MFSSNAYLDKIQRQRIRRDRRIAFLITAGGWFVLVTLLLLIWHLLSVTMPLLGQPELNRIGHSNIPEGKQILALSNIAGNTFVVTRDQECVHELLQKEDAQWRMVRQFKRSCDSNLVVQSDGSRFYVMEPSSVSRVRIYSLDPFIEGPYLQLILATRLPFTIAESDSNLNLQIFPDSWLVSAIADDGKRHLVSFDRNDFEPAFHQILDASAPYNFLKEKGEIIAFDNGLLKLLDERSEILQAFDSTAVPRAIETLPGDKAFIVQGADNQLQKWSLVLASADLRLQKLHQIQLDFSPSRIFLTSNSELALLAGSEKMAYYNTTTGEIVGEKNFGFSASQLLYSADRLYLINNREMVQFQLDKLSAITTLKSLWEEVWYEGYAEPDYVWQTTNASDNQQSKFSLVPLLIGSIKAAFLALFVAIPIGIGSAIYVAFFATEKMRKWIKPAIEMIEGVPSVVIGFIAAIWLLPLSEQYLFGLFLFLAMTPFFLAAFCLFQHFMRSRLFPGWEFLLVALFLFVFLWFFDIFVANNADLVRWFWTENALAEELQYSLGKNTFVLALALGFAIAPTIFSIAEDAIHEVPKSLKLASYAMGATPLQTLQRIVLVTALPGVLSAIMLGFARALGETMIVLMVSGNTPLASWSILDGVRTFSANLAIELPEAEVGSEHYQILFLTALVLFLFTFFVNTLAEMLRQQLRKRYQYV